MGLKRDQKAEKPVRARPRATSVEGEVQCELGAARKLCENDSYFVIVEPAIILPEGRDKLVPELEREMC